MLAIPVVAVEDSKNLSRHFSFAEFGVPHPNAGARELSYDLAEF
jgi:hypothetical protein